MKTRTLAALPCLLLLGIVAWRSIATDAGKKQSLAWNEVQPGLLRSPSDPAGYALLDGDAALLIDAPTDGAGLTDAGVKKIDGVLLTHYHRDSIAFAGKFLK